ncbi:MAG: hypothetical protein UDN39_06560, partial [Christensenellales bacterium]|nr:hypothetical protein [Christensenellales bacterium]
PAQSGRPDADGKAHALPRRIKSGQQRMAAGRENFIFFLCPLDGVRFIGYPAFPFCVSFLIAH